MIEAILLTLVLLVAVLYVLSVLTIRKVHSLEEAVRRYARQANDDFHMARYEAIARFRLLEEYLEVEYKEKSVVDPHYTEKED